MQPKFQELPTMQIAKLLITITTLPFVVACTTVREDPRSLPPTHTSLYQNTSAVSGGSRTGGGDSPTKTHTTVSEPQSAPIPARAGTQATKYLNTTASPYDRSGTARPLRHDTPDQR